MKATIEKPLNFETRSRDGLRKAIEFEMIIKSIIFCNTEDRLRHEMSDFNYKFYRFGFGANHMWVKEMTDLKNRLLIVEF